MSSGRSKTDDLHSEEESLELYSVEYLQECASGSARDERLAELRRRILHGAYRIDAERIAEEMLRRGDLDD